MVDLTNRVALVTGAAQGIGRATARECARAGARVIVNDLNASGVHALVEDIERQGGAAWPGPADVTNFAEFAAMVSRAEAHFGAVEVLINNAGGAPAGAAWTELRHASIDDVERFISLNLTSMFVCSRAVINGMIDRNYGKIVCVSSIAAVLGQQGGSSYAAAKAGIAGYVASVSKEVGKWGVNVNAVMYGNAPHHTRTEARQRELDTWSHLHRVGQYEEFAKAALFLASDEASYISGETMIVDGGLTRFALL